jgi:hypothetical protein
MTTLYVAEFSALAKSDKSDLLNFSVPPLREQTIAITATSLAVALPFLPQTQYVEISTDSVCSIAFAAGTTTTPPTPVATASNCRLAAGERIVRKVGLTPLGTTLPADGTGKAVPIQSVAVITNT